MKEFRKYLSRCRVYGIYLPSLLLFLRLCEKFLGVGYDTRQNLVLNFLRKNFDYLITKYKKFGVPDEVVTDDAPIWFCWYQGEESMPDIVKSCLRSIRKNTGNHSLMILDYKNIHNYVKFPQHIQERLERGDFNLVYLSDFLRNYLLSEYGGIWLDTTIYMLFPLKLPRLPFWTVKRECSDKKFVSRQRWTGFAMAGCKGNPINSFVRDLLSEYHKKYPVLIDHFLIDFTIALGYEDIPCIRQMLDNVPFNNKDLYNFQTHIYDDYNAPDVKYVKANHFLQKLHHRYKGCDNPNSYYYHIINDTI